MKRLFLIALILFLLLASACIQQAQNATPFSSATLLGCIPAWQLFTALPASLFATGALAAAVGIGAQFWSSLLPLCGAREIPLAPLHRLSEAGLWCGWATMASCLTALPSIFPWIEETNPFPYTPECYRKAIMAGAAIMVICHLMSIFFRGKGRLPIALLSAATALGSGQLWWQGRPLEFLAICLLLPLSLALLLQKRPLSPAQRWITFTALLIAVYAAGFAGLTASYPPSAKEAIATPSLLPLLLLLPPIIVMLSPWHNRPWLRRSCGLFSLASLLFANGQMLALPIETSLKSPLPPSTPLCYGLFLACMSILMGLHCLSFQKRKKN